MVKKYYPRALEESPLVQVVEIKSLKEIPQKIRSVTPHKPGRLCLELDIIPVREVSLYSSIFPGAEILDASYLIQRIRCLKSRWEISKLKQIAEKSALSFKYAKDLLSNGIEGPRLLTKVEQFMRRHGHQAMIRTNSFLLKKRPRAVSAYPLYCMGSHAILLQLIWAYQGYHLVEGRIIYRGRASAQQSNEFQALFQALEKIKELVRPGATWAEISTWLKKEEVEYRISSYGVGLEIMEPPAMGRDEALVFEPGMVLAVGIRPQCLKGESHLMETGLLVENGFSPF